MVNTTSDSLDPGPGLLSLREAVQLANILDVPTTITFNTANLGIPGSTNFATPQTITQTDQLSLGFSATSSVGSGTAYFYQVVAVTPNGDVASAELGAAGNTASLTWNAVSGATSYQVYRRVSGNPAPDYGLLATVAGTQTTYTDAAGTITGSLLPFAWLELSNTAPETIVGPAAGVTIDAAHLGRVFEIDAGAQVSLSGLTISDATRTDSFVVAGTVLNIEANTALTLNDSTLSNNTGVTVLDSGSATLTNCTISGTSGSSTKNTAIVLLTTAKAVLTNCTISGNVSLGIWATTTTSSVTLLNTIVAGNNAGGADVSGPGTFTSMGHNLIGNVGTTTGWKASDLTGTNSSPLNPGLDPQGLQDNGGPTQTIALEPGSKAIGAGADTTLAPPSGSPALSPTTGGSLNPGQTYYYEVTAVNGVGETTPSAEAHITLSGSNTAVVVSWSAATGPVTGYNIYRGTTSGQELLIGTVAAGTTQFTDTGSGIRGGPPPTLNTTTLTTDQRGVSRVGHVDIGAFQVGASATQSQTITFNPLSNQTYGAADFALTATASSGLSVSYTATGNATVYQDGNDNWLVQVTGAGTATITASQAGNSSYSAATSVSQTFTISQAQALLSIQGVNVTYDGNAHAATGTATGVESPNGTNLTSLLNLYYSSTGGQTYSSSAPVNAGDYEIYYTFNTSGSNTNYQAVTSYTDSGYAVDIARAKANITVTPYSVTYDGNPHTATGTATGVGGVNLLSVGDTLDLSGTTHTDATAGAVSDPWTFTDTTGNYNSTSGTVSNQIGQAGSTVTVTWTDGTSTTYDGQQHVATASWASTSSDGTGGPLPVSYVGINGTLYASSTTAPTNAGNYEASASFAGDTDHTGTSNVADFTIQAATLTVTGSGSQTYGGSPTFSASYSGFLFGQDPSVLGGTLAFSTTTTSSSNVGTYTAAVTPSGLTSSNYAISFVAGNMVVSQAATTLSLSSTGNPSMAGQSLTFTATEHVTSPGSGNPTGTVFFSSNGNPLGSGTLQTNNGVTTATYTTSAFTTVGTDTITATYGGDGNFQGSPTGTLMQQIIADTPAKIVLVAATNNQSASLATAFGTALQVVVEDAFGNVLSGVVVTFTVQVGNSGASGNFNGLATATATTSAAGVASAPLLKAGGKMGSFSIVASVAGLPASDDAIFNMTVTGRGSPVW